MKIVCLIDGLGLGGAQRQLIGLAKGLINHGHAVELVYYDDSNFYYDFAIQEGVKTTNLRIVGGKISKVINTHRYLLSISPDVIISYIDGANVIASLYKIRCPKTKIIVSERNTTQSEPFIVKMQYLIYTLADVIVPNSNSQHEYLIKKHQRLAKKSVVITNFTDTNLFKYKERIRSIDNRILVVGRVGEQKNVIRFIEAISVARLKFNINVNIRWIGNITNQDYYDRCIERIKDCNLIDCFTFVDKTTKIAEEYWQSDYFCLPSIYEGFPNVICEAMSCGLPIICSDVCDNSFLVEDGINGFLFNPYDINDMALSIKKIISMSSTKYQEISIINRRKAESDLSFDSFIGKYERIINQ